MMTIAHELRRIDLRTVSLHGAWLACGHDHGEDLRSDGVDVGTQAPCSSQVPAYVFALGYQPCNVFDG